MAYGRSGGFWIAKTNLEAMLDQIESDRTVGILGMRNATAVEVKRVLGEQDRQREKFPVEEQDHVDYIVHLGGLDPIRGLDGMGTWLNVGVQSPLYQGLRRCHARRAMKKAAQRRGRRPPSPTGP